MDGGGILSSTISAAWYSSRLRLRLPPFHFLACRLSAVWARMHDFQAYALQHGKGLLGQQGNNPLIPWLVVERVGVQQRHVCWRAARFGVVFVLQGQGEQEFGCPFMQARGLLHASAVDSLLSARKWGAAKLFVLSRRGLWLR